MNSDSVTTIIGYVLFAVSEILPLLNIPANGILHTLVIGFRDAFKSPEKDIELAQVVIHNQKDFATIVNTLSTNSVLHGIVQDLITNPGNIQNITTLQSQDDIASIVSKLRNDKNFKNSILKLLSDPTMYYQLVTPTPH